MREHQPYLWLLRRVYVPCLLPASTAAHLHTTLLLTSTRAFVRSSWILPISHTAGKRRYNIKLWKTFTDCFNCLPIAAIIDEKIFTMHGGLSPDLQSMEQIRRVMRPTDVPDTGVHCPAQYDSCGADMGFCRTPVRPSMV